MAGLVLSDASPLIGLARVDGLGWLPTLFGSVHLPAEVWAELTPDRSHPDGEALQAARAADWLRVLGPTPGTPALPDLDEGEAACIRHALADGGAALLLMDERAGRAVAMAYGLTVAGTAAVIGMARQRGLVPSARAVFERLHGSDFRSSAEVIRTVLRRFGELP